MRNKNKQASNASNHVKLDTISSGCPFQHHQKIGKIHHVQLAEVFIKVDD